jgi:hypothetical protein
VKKNYKAKFLTNSILKKKLIRIILEKKRKKEKVRKKESNTLWVKKIQKIKKMRKKTKIQKETWKKIIHYKLLL